MLPDHHCLIGLGSNMGEKARLISEAVANIAQLGTIEKLSSLYKTQPWGNEAQDFFLNAVLSMKTGFEPRDLLGKLMQIEADIGKQKKVHWGPRKIDLDILYFGQKIILDNSLMIPHPFLHLRNFVLIPMQEVAAGFMHPIFRKTTTELLEQCPDDSLVELYIEDDQNIFNGSNMGLLN